MITVKNSLDRLFKMYTYGMKVEDSACAIVSLLGFQKARAVTKSAVIKMQHSELEGYRKWLTRMQGLLEIVEERI